MTTCYGYTRVSTVKQGEGVSLEAQKDEITRYAQKHNLTISQWFEEKETAAKSGRPIFNAIIKDLLNHKADGLIVHKIDRSARNFRDWAKIGELADQGVAIHFATESLDFQSRGGRLTADIQAVIASDYIRNLREEAIKGIRGRLKQGLYPHMAPIGYLDQGGGKIKTHDPAKAPFVQELFEHYATGTYSIRSLCVFADKQGLRNRKGNAISRTCMENLLANPFYCGVVRIKRTGEIFKGIHEPLISATLFQRVQDLKSGRYHKKVYRHLYTYRGMFKCAGCGFNLIAERQKGKVYYRCHASTCATKCIREDVIETGISNLVGSLKLSDKRFASLEQLMEAWLERRAQSGGKLQALKLRYAELEGRIDQLTDALVDRIIDGETYKARKERLVLEQRNVTDNIIELGKMDAKHRDLRKFLELVRNVAQLYEIAEPQEKRILVQTITSNRNVVGEYVELEPSNWFQSTQNTVGVLFGGARRGNSRTSRHIDECFEEWLGAYAEAKQEIFLDQTMAIFDKYLGKPKKINRSQFGKNRDIGFGKALSMNS